MWQSLTAVKKAKRAAAADGLDQRGGGKGRTQEAAGARTFPPPLVGGKNGLAQARQVEPSGPRWRGGQISQ